ncbi:hypothetical protein ACFPRL_19815 [Pseudoclavibacter helvolus]
MRREVACRHVEEAAQLLERHLVAVVETLGEGRHDAEPGGRVDDRVEIGARVTHARAPSRRLGSLEMAPVRSKTMNVMKMSGPTVP